MRGALALAVLTIGVAGCTHDFGAFDPVSGANVSDSSTGPGSPAGDGGGDGSALQETGDGGPGGIAEASIFVDGSSCGADCRIEATSCAGTCAEIEQSCVAPCAANDGGCTEACLASESQCTSQCVTECETCTSGEGCVDPTGCMAAAP